MTTRARSPSTAHRRNYKRRCRVEIEAIDFSAMTERERRQAIAILSDLFASVLHERADELGALDGG